jgi:hypothetical protein
VLKRITGSHLDALVSERSCRHRERVSDSRRRRFLSNYRDQYVFAIVLNALLMWRKNCGPHALAELRRAPQEERAIFIIFPEGGRSRNGSMMPFKHGLGMLVAKQTSRLCLAVSLNLPGPAATPKASSACGN